MKIVVIGAGIAAECFKYYFVKNFNDKINQFELYQISSSKIPATTETTTSIVAKRGIKTGVSPLGDLLLAGHNEISSFIENNKNIQGIHRTKFLFSVSKTSQKAEEFKKRFDHVSENSSLLQTIEEGYLFEPEILVQSLKKITGNVFSSIDKSINSLEELQEYDFVFNFSGAQGKVWNILGSDQIRNPSLAQGSYLVCDNMGFDLEKNKYLVHEINGVNLIFRPLQKQLIIGATTVATESFLPDILSLKKMHADMSQIFEIPKFEKFEIKTGHRLKASKRMPYIGVGDQKNSYVVNALYKNGFNLCFLGAKKSIEYFKNYLSQLEG